MGSAGIADLADGAVARLRACLAPLLLACALPLVPAALIAATAPVWSPLGVRVLVVLLPLMLASLVATAAATHVLGDVGLGLRPSVGSAFRRVWKRRWAVLRVGLRAFFATAAGFLIIVPGFGRLASAQVVAPVLLLEEVGAPEAWRRARFLTRGKGGTVLGTQLVLVLGALAIAALPTVAVLLVIPRPASGSAALADARVLIAAIIAGTAVLAGLAAGRFTCFLSRREQLEAIDLQLALEALDAATPLPVTP
ncbi:MAG TPA: hypothetical protein VHE83_11445 [Mycobacteriales bacterium]|nr:hypothetical protein [Mycobacteriales bacterium]